MWSDFRDYSVYNYIDVYLLNLTPPPEVKKLVQTPSSNSPQPDIDGDLIAWVDYPNIFLYDITDASPPASLTSAGVNYGPRISGNRVTYYRDDGRIYLTTLDSSEPCPAASFTANVTSGLANLAVQFNDTSGDPNTTHWSWDFGDGTGSYEKDPVHVYILDGIYDVSLTVGNDVGRDYASNTRYIRVGPLPVVSFSANRTYGITPLPVRFTDTSSGSPTGWSWDFGDEITSTDQNPVHVYGSPGVYTVNLTVTNARGNTSGNIPGFIRALNGTSLVASTPVAGLQVTAVGGMQQVSLNVTDAMGYNATWLAFAPPPSSGWERMDFFSTDGIGFVPSGGVIRGNITSCTLESLDIIPHSFGTGVGNNLPLSYRLDLSAYPVDAGILATIWEGVIPEDNATFRSTLAETSTNFTSVLDIAYTLDFATRNLTGVQSATLNLSVSGAWVTKYGNQNNIAVVRLGDNLVNQTLNPSATFTDTATNLDFFTVSSPHGLSRFALVSAVGSSNLIQMGARVATQLIQSAASGSSGGSSPVTPRPTAQPAKVPVERQPATFYGEGKIDTTSAGITRDLVTIMSEDRGASLAVKGSTKAFDGTHGPLTLVTVRPVQRDSLPPVPAETGIRFTGIAYDVGPDGATFDPPARISFTVPDGQWSQDTLYFIRTYSPGIGSWNDIPTSVDPGTRIVSGEVSHLCIFGLFASVAPPVSIPPAERAPAAGPKPLPRTPMGTFTGMLGWLYDTMTAHIQVSFLILLGGFASVYAWTRRAWLARYRTWITLYLASLTGLLWAAFRVSQGGLLPEAIFISTTVVGLNLIVHIFRFDRIHLLPRAGPVTRMPARRW
ncbi:MAG TPA: PKD domain-containing protein [Methanomicrobiales archaeon]|nr:PKD domain-containing protein [Methanomicrobiales archaeon]